MNMKHVIGLVLIGFCCFANASQGPGAERIDGLGLVKPCFFGLFANYQQWRDKVISSQQKVDQLEAEKLFDDTFPQEKYTRLKNSVDCYLFPTQIDDIVVPAYYSAPKNTNSGSKLPVIIFNRAGNGNYGSINFADLIRTIMPLSEKGYIVLASKLRGSSKGHRKGPAHVGWDEFGGEDVNDVLELLNVVDKLPGADPDNVFMVGYSRGGMMTYLAANQSNRFKAIATIAGISDLNLIAQNRPKFANMLEKRIKYSSQNKIDEFNKRSAIEWFGESETKAPLLMIHGKLDVKVSVEHTESLAAKLSDLGYPEPVTDSV